jgi:hypothetical protein
MIVGYGLFSDTVAGKFCEPAIAGNRMPAALPMPLFAGAIVVDAFCRVAMKLIQPPLNRHVHNVFVGLQDLVTDLKRGFKCK